MSDIFLARSGNRPLSFKGEELATSESSPNNASPRWSGETGRWRTLRLFQTEGGTFVFAQTDHTQWAGERDFHAARRYPSAAALVEGEGRSPHDGEMHIDELLATLLEEAEVDYAEVIS
jgi:hypothetical protein